MRTRTCSDCFVRHSRVAALIALILLPVLSAAAEAPARDRVSTLPQSPTLAQRLDRLAAQLEEARIEHHIPGMAIAVVKDDEIIFARGFGLADIENEDPVTPETIFAIGSSTKAFTAALIGMLIDEGLMSWDDPATKWLPDFKPPIDTDDEDAVLTVRDMLCHRSGFTRMSLLFASGEASREEVLARACTAEPYAPFREKFHYNNVMYMAAGMSAAAAAKSTWEDLMRERLLVPLRMNTATLSITDAQKDERLSRGYSYDEVTEEWEQLPMRDLTTIAPAGAINANVLEVANWIRFQLGCGGFEGTRLLSEENLAETWQQQCAIAPGVDYGLGWMLREWNGRKVVEHGGNIDGFAAEVALLPEENLGFVLLANVSYSPLQGAAPPMVFETLVGEWPVETVVADGANAGEGESFSEYEGVYIANYAQFEDERFTVAVNDAGKLTIDIPSQTTYTLKVPGEDGRRAFAQAPGIAASFDRDQAGEVTMLRLYQGGLQFEVPREGYTYPVEIPLTELDKYLGTYRFDAMNADIDVIVRNNRLALDIPNQMVFELHPPDDEGKRQFRANDVMEIAVAFNDGDFGRVESMTLYQMGREFECPRTADATQGDLPTLEEVFELARLDERQEALARAGLIHLAGRARFINSGLDADYTLTFDAQDRFRSDIEMEKFGSIRVAVTPDSGAIDVSFSPFEELEGKWLEQTRGEHPRSFLGDWRDLYDEIRVVSVGETDGRETVAVRVKRGDLPASTLHLDRETGDVVRIDSRQEVPGMEGVSLPVKTTLRRWTEINGLRIPFEMEVETQQNGRLMIITERLETGGDMNAAYFILTRNEEGAGG